mmetsp:Transcript_40184/g.62756  ORF Transcript_40184/g.62756 Transcript_40184/m.62756 type:complete len:96 (-) Transcript_40184:175-462(-)
MRGIGVTCYSHNGNDLYCNKPPEGECWTTGGWCPPPDANDEILPSEGVSAFCGLTPLTLKGFSLAPPGAGGDAAPAGAAAPAEGAGEAGADAATA